jgi:hypothetical protein
VGNIPDHQKESNHILVALRCHLLA